MPLVLDLQVSPHAHHSQHLFILTVAPLPHPKKSILHRSTRRKTMSLLTNLGNTSNYHGKTSIPANPFNGGLADSQMRLQRALKRCVQFTPRMHFSTVYIQYDKRCHFRLFGPLTETLPQISFISQVSKLDMPLNGPFKVIVMGNVSTHVLKEPLALG